ncbi:MAG: hypothetical protein WCG55_00205 [bacterium]
MLFTIILFFLSVIVAFALIGHKIWLFRTGKILPESYEAADWHDLSIESIRMRLVDLAKFAVHHFVLMALKVWILISTWVRNTDGKVKARLNRLITKNGHLTQGGRPSGFLKNIRAHKDKVTDAIRKESGDMGLAKKEEI